MDPVTGTSQLNHLAVGGGAASADVVLHAEQLTVTTRRVAAERVRLVRRIVTETRIVSVEVRREVLDVERIPLGDAIDVSDLAATSPAAPVTIVLHEEYPLVTLGVRAVERVTATVTQVTGETAVRAEVSSEQIEVVNVPPPAPRV